MSLLWADGFENDSLLARKYTVQGNNSLPTVTSGRNGNSMYLTGATTTPGSITKVFPSAQAHATIIVGFAWHVVESSSWPTGSGDPIVNLFGDGGTTEHIYLIATATTGGDLRVGFQGGGILGSSSGLGLTNGVWYYIEFKALISDTVGTIEVKVNGTTAISASSLDTKNGGTNTTFDGFLIGARTTNNTHCMVDDLYVCNGAGSAYNDFLGDVAIETLRPSGNGNSSQLVGSDADSTDNYQLVDEATYSAVDFVGSSTSTNKDTYAFGDLVRSTGQVKGVMVQGVMAKSDSGSKSAKLVTRTASTDYSGSSQALSTSDVPYVEVWEQNPNTASDWTISEVNGAEFGVEVV